MIAITAARAWTFLKSPSGIRLAVLIAAALALWGFGEARYRAGMAHEVAAQTKRLEKARKHVAKVEANSAEITKDVGEALVKTQTEIRWRTRTQLQEVVRYVPVESDRACIVNVGALRLHDHAFSGLPGLPGPSGGSIEVDSGVSLSALIADDVAFAGTAYDWRAEALAWRSWYPRQAALWNSSVTAAPKP